MAITSAFSPLQPKAVRVLSTLVLIVTALCLHNLAVAQSLQAGLNIDAALGFSDTVRLGNWAPLTITVENTAELVEATLEVDVVSGNQLNGTVFTTTLQRKLQLNAGARKRFQFTVYINNFTRPIQIRIRSGAVFLAKHSIDLRQRFTDSRLLLVLSRNLDLDYLNASSAHQLRVAYPHPDMLPYQWQGYAGVAAMVVHGVTLARWSERQFLGLKNWIGQGGTLVVSGGPDYASLRTPRLAELLPAVPSGLTVINSDKSIRRALGDSFIAPRSFQVHRVLAAADLTTLKAGDIPLLVEKKLGLGRVVYMTFDVGAYPFNGWTGMGQLWLKTLALSRDSSVQTLPALDSSAIPALFNSSVKRFPHRMIVLSFLIAYFGVLSAIYRIVYVGTQSNRWFAWFAPLIFLPVTYLLFVSVLSPAAIHAATVSIIKPLRNSPFARLEIDIGMYSNRSGIYALPITQSNAVFLPAMDPGRQDQATNWVLGMGAATSIKAVDRSPYILHTLRGTDLVNFDFQLAVEVQDTGLQIALQNRSYQPLEYSWLIFNGWLYPVGEIQGTDDTVVYRSNDQVVSVYDRKALAHHLKALTAKRQSDIQSVFTHSVTRLRNEVPLQKNEALFVALPQTTKPVIAVNKQAKTREITLIVSRVTVTSQKTAILETDLEDERSDVVGADAR